MAELWVPYKIVEVINVYKDNKWHAHIIVEEDAVDVVKAGTCYEYVEDLPEEMLDGYMQPAHEFFGSAPIKPEEV